MVWYDWWSRNCAYEAVNCQIQTNYIRRSMILLPVRVFNRIILSDCYCRAFFSPLFFKLSFSFFLLQKAVIGTVVNRWLNSSKKSSFCSFKFSFTNPSLCTSLILTPWTLKNLRVEVEKQTDQREKRKRKKK